MDQMCTCESKHARKTPPKAREDLPNARELKRKDGPCAWTRSPKPFLTLQSSTSKRKRMEVLFRRLCMIGRDKGRFRTCSSVASTWVAVTTRSACIRKASSFRCSPKPVPSLLLCEFHSVQVASGAVFLVRTRHSLERVTSSESSPHVGGIPRKYFFLLLLWFRRIQNRIVRAYDIARRLGWQASEGCLTCLRDVSFGLFDSLRLLRTIGFVSSKRG
mmetsp:Transcript_10893/g.67304  ORF Transcript_10893/g.67304 Transcript_10893/m.67304 type:complete len:217 (+) Transcript_10893:260-910(+)